MESIITKYEEYCSYEQCLTCHCGDCTTGQIARKQGETAYNKFIEEMENAETIKE